MFRYAVRIIPIQCPDASGIGVRILPKYADANKKVKVVHVHDSYVKYTTVSEWDGSYIDTSLGNYQTIADIRYYID